MGAFNILACEVKCPDCKKDLVLRLQFKHGDCWQHEYKLGDELQWGGNDRGVRDDDGEVCAYGINESERCPHCGVDLESFAIRISRNKIVSAAYDPDAWEKYRPK